VVDEMAVWTADIAGVANSVAGTCLGLFDHNLWSKRPGNCAVGMKHTECQNRRNATLGMEKATVNYARMRHYEIPPVLGCKTG
jgi:hypothetical protein